LAAILMAEFVQKKAAERLPRRPSQKNGPPKRAA
jgi:hypothetical protein